MSVVLKSAVAAGIGLVVSATALAAHGAQAPANRDNRTGPSRVAESLSCRGRDGHDPAPAGPGRQPPGAPSSADVGVPPTVLLRIDSLDRVIAAATNTGCAPRRGDDVYFVEADGTITAAPASEVDACDWTGDFVVPGRFQPQHCHAHPAPSGPPHRRYNQAS